MSVTFAPNLPTDVLLGEPRRGSIDVDIAFSSDTTSAFKLLKIATVEVEAAVRLGFGDGAEVAYEPIKFGPVSVPEVGDVHLKGTIDISTLRYTKSGTARVTAHDIDLGITARKSTGQLAAIPDSANPFSSHCTQDAGVDNVLATIAVYDIADWNKPTPPQNVKAVNVTHDSVTLAWEPPSFQGAGGFHGYEVFVNGTSAAKTQGPETMATVSDLPPDTEYTITVRTHSPQSDAGKPITVRTLPAVTHTAYDIAGAAKVKTATVALAGTAAAELNVVSGQFSADVALRPAKAAMQLFGAFPGTAEVAFTPDGKVTGTWAGGALAASANVGVTLSKLTLFGFPVASAPCRTSVPAAIDLHSAPGFAPASGGTLTGGFTLPSFTGCWPYSGLITSAVSGPGNTIELGLRPAA